MSDAYAEGVRIDVYCDDVSTVNVPKFETVIRQSWYQNETSIGGSVEPEDDIRSVSALGLMLS